MSAVEAAPSPGTYAFWSSPDVPLRIGVSSCLLGNTVRFDAGHARARFVTDTLSTWFEMVPVCPEVEIGMGVPRPTIRLVDEGEGVRLIAPSTGEDFTDSMRRFSETRVDGLRALGVDGFVLKKGSPSCGMERIKVYAKGMPQKGKTAGLFAETLMERFPALPVEEEGRLNDPLLRENFIERVFSRNRFRVLLARGLTRRGLIEFHTAHKLLIRSHNEAGYARMGKLVGSIGKLPDEELFAQYEIEFQNSMRTKASVKKHVNVLQHALGYLKTLLSPGEKRELLTTIEDYRKGLLPLIVPLSLVRYNVRRFDVEYLLGQLYFDPHPKELMLRNHA